MRKLVVVALVGAIGLAVVPRAALASGSHAVRDRWTGAAIGAGAVVAGALILNALTGGPAVAAPPPAPVLHTPPPVVYGPPAVYAPPPVVYHRPPVIVTPPPVVYRPPVIVYPPRIVHRHVPPPRYWDRYDHRWDRPGREYRHDRNDPRRHR
jgi:hypothetical protein